MVKKAGAKKSPESAEIHKTAHKVDHMPGSFLLSWQSLSFFKKNWAILAKIMAIYLVLDFFLANGLVNISRTVNSFRDSTTSTSGLLGSDSSVNQQASSFFQTALLIIASLVIIWALRQLMAGNKISVKEAYYKAVAPLIPFILVTLVIILQLLPLTIGAAILGLVLSSLVGTQIVVVSITALVSIGLAAWSIYMLCGSILAIYIVTLPDMQPRQALRSSRDLVSGRRLLMVRKLLFAPIAIMAAIAIVVFPLLLLWAPLAILALYLMSIIALLFFHTYFYGLYRSLI